MIKLLNYGLGKGSIRSMGAEKLIAEDNYGKITKTKDFIRLRFKSKGIEYVRKIARHISVKSGKYKVRDVEFSVSDSELDLSDLARSLCEKGYKTSIAFYRCKSAHEMLVGKVGRNK